MGKGAADKVNFGRKVSRTAPVDPYRRTLRGITEIRLDELLQHLRENFHYQEIEFNHQHAADFVRLQKTRPELIVKQLPQRLSQIVVPKTDKVTDKTLHSARQSAVQVLSQVVNESRDCTEATAREVSKVRETVDVITPGEHSFYIARDNNNEHLFIEKLNSSKFLKDNPDLEIIYTCKEKYLVVEPDKFRDALSVRVVTGIQNNPDDIPGSSIYFDNVLDLELEPELNQSFDDSEEKGGFPRVEVDGAEYFLVEVDGENENPDIVYAVEYSEGMKG